MNAKSAQCQPIRNHLPEVKSLERDCYNLIPEISSLPGPRTTTYVVNCYNVTVFIKVGCKSETQI